MIITKTYNLSSSAVHAYNGGNAGVGFISGTINSYYGTTPGNGKGLIENTFTNAILGGATTALGGGKFANGAQSGAFRYLFNDAMHYASKYITNTSEKFNREDWSRVDGSYTNKNKIITVDSTKIAVELKSNAFPPTYQQRISISSYPLDKNGNTYPMVAPLGFFNHTDFYVTGSHLSRIIIYQGSSNNSRWWVSEPKQRHEHGGVNHSWFNVYVPK